jgi:hypothetical protein
MKGFLKLATACSLVAAMSAAAVAQETHTEILKSPVFLLQPGVITSGAVSCSGCSTRTEANLRFATVIPTATPYFSLVGGAQWGVRSQDHGAIIFYGAIIPITIIGNMTDNWLSISVDPLGVTTGSGKAGTNFYLEGAVVFNVGKMMTSMGGPWAGTGVYFLVDQQMTQLPKDAAGNTDRFNPGLLYGVSIPIAPWR